MATTISTELKIDDSVLSILNETREIFIKDMLFYNAMILYKKNKLSLGKAAYIAEMDKFDFIKRLSEENITIFDYDDAQLEDIFEGANRLLNCIK
jgi:predicted HTH domain antitoxin